MSILPSPSVLALGIVVALVVRHLFRKRYDVDYLPCPRADEGSLLFGHEYNVFQHESNEMYTKWAKRLGPLYRMKAALFHPDVIVAGDHAAVQHIFQYSEKYVKSPVFRPPVANLLGRGLVWAEGEEHKKQRRILAPAFSPENLKGMYDDVWESAEKMEARLVNEVTAQNGAATFNIVEYTSACTLDIIGRVAFGHDFGAGKSAEAKAISVAWTKHVNMGLTFGGFLAPQVIQTFPWIVKLPIATLQAQGTTKVIVTELASRILEKGIVNDKDKDILSLLMRAARDSKGPASDGLTAEQIVDNINTFIMVGHETTAGSVNFALLELARNPEMQQRLREEVLSAGNQPTFEEIQKLPYLDAVVKEGLRMHPASPHTERLVLEDDIIPLSVPIHTDDGRTISHLSVKAGQVFHIPFTAMQVNTEVWGPDAFEFKPERWLTPGGVPAPGSLPHGWSGLISFCDGPRMCIGYRLAIVEFKVMLATLVRTLAFEPTHDIIREVISPTLQPIVHGKAQLPLRIKLAQS
ncbi:cytochrome P450 [Dentipellis sp. KUC8613]|nr:cytochrome P450 [Dentipellis sp. KUC8613]